uniref:Uncharacterized protein n=1 Tax=Elaeophora elaphi TaxID=1147741 RepID=A0A0R3RU88_9BILA
MFTLSVIATLSAAVTVESLILYYPAYPNYVVPKHMQSFERNAPPRVFAKDRDIPSSGIVYLTKSLQENLLDLQSAQSDLEEGNKRQKLHSDQTNRRLEVINNISMTNSKDTSLLPLLPVKSPQVDIVSSQQSKNSPSRFYSIYDSKSKQFLTSNEPNSLSLQRNDNAEGLISKPYHDGTAQLVSSQKGANIALFSQSTDQLGMRTSIPFGSDQKIQPLNSQIPETKISSRYSSGRRIFVVDSDAVLKPFKFFLSRH